MADQPWGWIYYLRFDGRHPFDTDPMIDWVKIGYTIDPRVRVATLRREWGPLTPLAWHRGNFRLETYLHHRFAALAKGHEWFDPDDTLDAHIAVVQRRDREDPLWPVVERRTAPIRHSPRCPKGWRPESWYAERGYVHGLWQIGHTVRQPT